MQNSLCSQVVKSAISRIGAADQADVLPAVQAYEWPLKMGASTAMNAQMLHAAPAENAIHFSFSKGQVRVVYVSLDVNAFRTKQVS